METISKVLLYLVPLLFSVSFHEMAHAWVAEKRGDSTGRMLGRVTMNPVAHIDPIGSIALPAIFYALSGFIFAYAKPVPVVERNLKNQRWDMAVVAIAGPVSNLVLAVGFTLGLLVLNQFGNDSGPMQTNIQVILPMQAMFYIAVQLNVVLAFLNLIPIPPLDGGRIWGGLFPHLTNELRWIEQYGMIVLIVLLFTRVLDYLIFKPAMAVAGLLLSLAF